MRIVLVLFSLFTMQFGMAQESGDYAYGIFNFDGKKAEKIFTNDTRIRETPSISGKILDSLAANSSILIVSQSPVITRLGERSANWYKISYTKNNTVGEGFVWGGNLAIKYLSKSGLDFLFGMQKSGKEWDQESQMDVPVNYAAVKAFNGNELVSEAIFKSGIGESLSYADFEIEDNRKLKNVDFILKSLVSGEACGIPSYEQRLLFANNELVHLPLQMSIGDADMFYHSEDLVFPNDKGGKPNTIFLKMEEMEKDEKDKEHFKRRQDEYRWDGKVLSQILTLK